MRFTEIFVAHHPGHAPIAFPFGHQRLGQIGPRIEALDVGLGAPRHQAPADEAELVPGVIGGHLEATTFARTYCAEAGLTGQFISHLDDFVREFSKAQRWDGLLTGLVYITDEDDGSSTVSIDLSSLPDPDAAVSVSGAVLTIDPARRLADALAAEGYAAVAVPTANGIQLCQHNCPVAHVAAEFPQFCEAETEAFGRLLGPSRIELVQALGRTPRRIFAGRFWGDPGFIHVCFDVQGMDALSEACRLGPEFPEPALGGAPIEDEVAFDLSPR